MCMDVQTSTLRLCRAGCRREQEQRMVHGIVLSYNQESDLHQARPNPRQASVHPF